MHLLFIPYGEQNAVNFLLRQMECQKYQLPYYRADDKKKTMKHVWVGGNVRYCPGGIIDYVFPAANLDIILRSLDLHLPHHYQEMKWQIGMGMKLARKAFNLKPIPATFDDSKHLVWIKDAVNIIPIGFREDIMDWKDPDGTVHEAL